jgi:hypothetical protein
MIENREKEILSEVFRLIEEQTRALGSRLCAEVAAQCEERSTRIRNLLQQVGRHKHSELIESFETADTRH